MNFLLELVKVKGYSVKEYGEADYGRFGILELACDFGWHLLKGIYV